MAKLPWEVINNLQVAKKNFFSSLIMTSLLKANQIRSSLISSGSAWQVCLCVLLKPLHMWDFLFSPQFFFVTWLDFTLYVHAIPFVPVTRFASHLINYPLTMLLDRKRKTIFLQLVPIITWEITHTTRILVMRTHNLVKEYYLKKLDRGNWKEVWHFELSCFSWLTTNRFLNS